MFFDLKKEEKTDKKESLKRHFTRKLDELKNKEPTPSNFKEFFGLVIEFFAEYFHFSKNISVDEIENLIDEKDIKKNMFIKIKLLLETINRIKYGGIELNKAEFKELVSETIHIIKKL